MPDPATTIPDLAGTLAALDAMLEAGPPDDGSPQLEEGPSDPFDYVPVTSWSTFRTRLAGALASLATDQYLILSTRAIDGQHDYYVQFAQMGPAGFRAEAVANGYLPGPAQLPSAVESYVPALGWQAPRRTKGRPENFHREWPPMALPWSTIASLAIRTLREIYVVSSPAELRYRRFCREGGPDIPTPLLGIAPELRLRQPAAEAVETARAAHEADAPESTDRSRPEDPGELIVGTIETWLRPLKMTGDAARTGPASWRRTVADETLFLRILPAPMPTLRVYASVLTAPSTPELLVAVNELNSELSYARAIHVNGDVFVSLEVPAGELEEQELEGACAMLTAIARQATVDLAAFAPRPGPSSHPVTAGLLN